MSKGTGLRVVQVDASYRDAVAGIAGVLHSRGAHVLFVEGLSVSTSLKAEKCALARAAGIADDRGWSRVRFETDAANLIKWFARSWLGSRSGWEVRAVSRNENGAAHAIAYAAFRLTYAGREDELANFTTAGWNYRRVRGGLYGLLP